MGGDGIAVGLVGAGPWAELVHGPVLAGAAGIDLAGVWARRPEAAERLAGRLDTTAYDDPGRLFAACDAVAFCVPPQVQAELAVQAAQARKHLLLEKPLAGDLPGALALAEAVDAAGVGSMMVLTWRYAAAVRDGLAQARDLKSLGGRGQFVSGALLGGGFATPWRLERGPLFDLGPHVIDLLDAALGPVTGVQAHGDLLGWVGLLLEHEGGAVSEASLCGTAKIDPHRAGVEVYGADGMVAIDCVAAVTPASFATLAEELVTMVRAGGGHPLDVAHGVRLQRILDQAERQLLRR
jgi:predicted dehydrogenase